AAYPDGANTYLASEVKSYLLSQGCSTPIVTTGKIRSPEEAEEILERGDADLIGMARALLADPDWTLKLREGRRDKIIRCIYGNVCKNLDENFRKVRCVLWPKGSLQAPESSDTSAPSWPSGRGLVAAEESGRVHLFWKSASDAEGI